MPGDPAYPKARLEFNRRVNKFPRVIVFCRSVRDVVNAVKWARERKVRIRVRSGRHSYEGFSTLNGGIVIDVSPMRKVSIDRHKRIATVQTGIPLGMLYSKLWTKRLAIPAGTAPDVGVAGLALGGGIGLLSRKYGLTCDSLKSVEMVVASGTNSAKRIVADNNRNADLLWASRGGGGGNFGIATSFKLRVRPIRNVAIYRVLWPWKDLEAAYSAWQTWFPAVTDRLTTTIDLQSRQAGKIESTGQLLGSADELKRLIQPLLRAGTPIEVSVRTVPFIKAVEFFAESDLNLAPKFKISGTYAFKPLPPEGIRVLRRFLANAPNRHASIWSQSLAGAVARIPPTATAYVHRQARNILELSSRWFKDEEAARNADWVHRLRQALKPYTRGDYVNFPDLSIRDWQQAYYGVNFKRLTRIKRKYDPRNVFRFAQSIPPATAPRTALRKGSTR